MNQPFENVHIYVTSSFQIHYASEVDSQFNQPLGNINMYVTNSFQFDQAVRVAIKYVIIPILVRHSYTLFVFQTWPNSWTGFILSFSGWRSIHFFSDHTFFLVLSHSFTSPKLHSFKPASQSNYQATYSPYIYQLQSNGYRKQIPPFRPRTGVHSVRPRPNFIP